MNGRSSEQAMSLREAAQWIANHMGVPAPNPSTVNRWVVHGVRGVRLEAQRVGAKFWTSPNNVARFLDELNAVRIDPSLPAAPLGPFVDAVRRQQVDAACEQLNRLCAGFGCDEV